MNTGENPYAVPQVPVLTKADPREGTLWYVSEGVLHVRDGANLPNVCLSGASPSEAGERKDLDIVWSSAWARYLPSVAFLAFLVWVVFQSEPWDALEFGGFAGMLLVMFIAVGLVWRQSKRAHLHVFQCARAKRNESQRSWLEGLIVILVVLGGFEMSRMLPETLSDAATILLIGTPSFLLGGLQRLRRVRACGFESGWFALANVHPAAIARLQEIESRLCKSPPSRKPS